MAGPLTDAEQTGLFGDTSKPAPTAPTSAVPVATPVPSTSPLTTQQQQALFGDTSKPAPAPAASDGASGSTLGDWANAFQAGTYRGLANVVNAPSAWFGLNPLIDTEGSLLTAGEKQAAAAHPVVSGVGQAFGQAVGTSPLLLAPGLPEAVGGTGMVGTLARGAITGAGLGAAQNVLTAGENPQEDLATRALRGAELGAPFGLAGGALERAFGAGKTITQDIQAAGNRMAQSGLDVTGANLTQGAAATPKVAQQANKAWGDLFGQTTPNFKDTTLNTIMPKLGQDVGNTAAAGQVAQSAMIPRTGQTVADTFSDIASDYPKLPLIQRLLRNVQAKFDPATGVLDGSDFQDLVRHNSPLDLATRSKNADISEAAEKIQQALQDGFSQSSAPGVADAYSLAREKYKLGIAAEKNADPQGNLVPANLYETMRRMYPDISRLGSGSSLTDQAVQFARDANQLYGGAAAAAPKTYGIGEAVPYGLGTGLWYGAHMLPAALANPLVAGAAAAVPVAARGAQYLGARYQMGKAFGQSLLARGPQQAGSYLANPLSVAGTALTPQGQVRRRTQ